MKKTKRDEGKKLSIEVATIRKLESELTPEQLKAAFGGDRPERPSGVHGDGQNC